MTAADADEVPGLANFSQPKSITASFPDELGKPANDMPHPVDLSRVGDRTREEVKTARSYACMTGNSGGTQSSPGRPGEPSRAGGAFDQAQTQSDLLQRKSIEQGLTRDVELPNNWTRVLRGLVHMGFRATDARRTIEILRERISGERISGGVAPPVEQLLRDALAILC